MKAYFLDMKFLFFKQMTFFFFYYHCSLKSSLCLFLYVEKSTINLSPEDKAAGKGFLSTALSFPSAEQPRQVCFNYTAIS